MGNMARDCYDHDQLKILVNGIRDCAVYMLDREGTILTWNAGGERLKGYSALEVIGRNFNVFYTPEDIARGTPQRALWMAAKEGHYEAEGWRVRKDGSQFWADVLIDAIYDDAGTVVGFAKLTRDCTERLQHSAELGTALKLAEAQAWHAQQARREAEYARQKAEAACNQAREESRSKSLLMASASHDLSQPLQALTIFQGIVGQYLSGPGKEALSKARICLALMKTHLDDLMEIGRFDSGSITAQFEPVAMERIIVEAIIPHEEEARKKSISLRAVQCSIMVNTDAALAERMLMNLVSNAVKYTDDGGTVLVGCRRKPRIVTVHVYDTGIGIPEDKLQEIFLDFVRVSPTKRVYGSGLGLAIVDRTARALGTQVNVNSWIGKGSCFSFSLPRI